MLNLAYSLELESSKQDECIPTIPNSSSNSNRDGSGGNSGLGIQKAIPVKTK